MIRIAVRVESSVNAVKCSERLVILLVIVNCSNNTRTPEAVKPAEVPRKKNMLSRLLRRCEGDKGKAMGVILGLILGLRRGLMTQ
jgi:hypothetical protein